MSIERTTVVVRVDLPGTLAGCSDTSERRGLNAQRPGRSCPAFRRREILILSMSIDVSQTAAAIFGLFYAPALQRK